MLIRELNTLIDNNDYPTKLRGGDICIHIDVNKGICGISLITDYADLNELSLRTLLDDKEKKEKKEKTETKSTCINALDTDWKCGKVQNDRCSL